MDGNPKNVERTMNPSQSGHMGKQLSNPPSVRMTKQQQQQQSQFGGFGTQMPYGMPAQQQQHFGFGGNMQMPMQQQQQQQQ